MHLIQWLIGPMLSRVVMPAQNRKDTYKELRKLKSKDGVGIKQEYIDSTGGAKINVATFKKKGGPKSERVIAFAVGNGHGYEKKFDNLVQMANRYPNATIVAFNFRNVLGSTGQSFGEQDWIDDAKAVAMHIKAQGFKNEHIAFNGFSLGGAITTIMIARLYQEERAAASKEDRDKVEPIRLVNQRSLASLVDVLLVSTLGQNICAAVNVVAYGLLAAGLIAGASAGFSLALGATAIGSLGAALGSAAGLFSLLHSKVCFAMSRPLAHLAGVLSVGRIFALDAYMQIPEHARDHIIASYDTTIPQSISLGQGVKFINSKKKTKIWRKLNPLLEEEKTAKTRAQKKELNDKIEPLLEELINIKDSKIKHRFRKNGHCAHNDDLSNFTTYHKMRDKPLSGQKVLERKLERLLKFKPAKA